MNNGSAPPIIRQHVKHQGRSHHHNSHGPHNNSHMGGHSNLSNTVSQQTVSTQSTGSNASWEDRSVGGEIEEVGVHQRYNQKVSPSLHETHFEEEDLELPRYDLKKQCCMENFCLLTQNTTSCYRKSNSN